jgi:4-amino-4-deoxy-L-arabinose transferase-like glycosyltransferase
MSAITLARKGIRSITIAPLVGLVVAGGVALRLYAIGAKSLWVDESFSIWMASQPLGALWRFTVQLDQHPPLYYALLHFWLALGDGEAVVRGFSALWGALTLPVMYLIGERIGGRALGLLSALILAISPLHVWFGQQARMYTMLMFFASMAILCMLHLLENQAGDRGQATGDRSAGRSVLLSLVSRLATFRWWLGFVVFTTLTMLGHNTAVFFPVAIGLFIAGAFGIPALARRLRETRPPTTDHRPPQNREPRTKNREPPDYGLRTTDYGLRTTDRSHSTQRQLWVWTIGLGAALLLWLPWLPSFLIQSRRVDDEFWIQPPTLKTVLEHWRNLGSAFAPGGAYLIPLVLAFAVLALLGVWRLRRRPAVLALLLLLLLAPFAGSLLVSLRRPIFYTRTLIWTSIPLYLLLAAGLLQLRFRLLIGAATLGLVLLNAGSLWGYYRQYEPEDWRGVAGYIAAQARPGDVLLFNAGWMQIPFDYYYRRVGAPIEEHGLPADLFERGILEPKMTRADIARLDALVAGRARVWLMYSHDWYTDPQRIIPRHLGDTLGEIEVRNFKGVKVYLYRGR